MTWCTCPHSWRTPLPAAETIQGTFPSISSGHIARRLLCGGRCAKGALITAKVKAVGGVTDTLLRNKQKGMVAHLIRPGCQCQIQMNGLER